MMEARKNDSDLEDVDDKDKDGDVLGKVNQALNKSGLPQG
jgi:hypothetical protein